MAFEAKLDITEAGIAKITLTGELDGSVAEQFKTTVEDAASQNAKRLVLMLSDLSYMSSAGIRVFIFAKQHMGGNVDIYVVGAQEQIVDTLEMTGMQHSVVMLDQYDADQIEKF